jgi:molybdopterin synthase catalytic subunit
MPVTIPITIRLQQDDFDISHEIRALTHDRIDIGAVVSFSGICRGGAEGGVITALTLEHYPGMAAAEIRRHVDQAIARWPSRASPSSTATAAWYREAILYWC